MATNTAKTKIVTMPPHFTGPDASLWLMKKEARGFVVSQIEITPQPSSNKVTLLAHPTGHYPNDCKLLPASDPLPDGFEAAPIGEWLVLIQDKPRLSKLWRKSGS